MLLTELKPNVIVRGPIFPEPVQVIVSIPMGASVKLVGKGLVTGQVHEPILDAAQIATLEATPDSLSERSTSLGRTRGLLRPNAGENVWEVAFQCLLRRGYSDALLAQRRYSAPKGESAFWDARYWPVCRTGRSDAAYTGESLVEREVAIVRFKRTLPEICRTLCQAPADCAAPYNWNQH